MPRRLLFDRALEPGKDSILLDFSLDPGLHALVGLPPSGTLSIARLAAGIVRPRSGQVTVGGRVPYADPALRARIGATTSKPVLPDLGTVEQLFHFSSRAGNSRSILDALGLSALTTRRLRTLSPDEMRTVDLALALSTDDPLALVLTEPFAAGADRAALLDALSRAARAGACVVVVTASVMDAADLGGLVHLFEGGRVVRTLDATDAFALPGRDVELRVVTDDPRALTFELSRDEAVTSASWDADRGSTVSVRGPDLDRTALAIARAARDASARIASITPVAPGLDELRAASSGLALAAYHAAYQYGFGRAPSVPAPPEPASPASPSEGRS